MSTFRLVLVCNSTSKVIPAIRSRCLGVRVAAPSLEEISRLLMDTVRREHLTMPSALADRIAHRSERNLRRALLIAEACKVKQYGPNSLSVRKLEYSLLH